jgi:GNAT superfamily N-acetyltransferase
VEGSIDLAQERFRGEGLTGSTRAFASSTGSLLPSEDGARYAFYLKWQDDILVGYVMVDLSTEGLDMETREEYRGRGIARGLLLELSQERYITLTPQMFSSGGLNAALSTISAALEKPEDWKGTPYGDRVCWGDHSDPGKACICDSDAHTLAHNFRKTEVG